MDAFSASDGTGIAYRDAGGGPAIVCLAGLTRNSSDFDYVRPHLAGLRVVEMDYRGRGASDWADPATYTVPREAQDAVELLDHLGIARAAILGTSRGGIIAMMLAATAKDRLSGVMLNDVGPVVMEEGLDAIRAYIGRNPPQKTYAEAEETLATRLPGFSNVPPGRWAEEARRHYRQTPEGLQINYDPALRGAVLAAFDAPQPDLWPLFDAMEGLPLACVRAVNSNILSRETFDEMRRRRPDMIAAEVPERGHVPFLDEPASLQVLSAFKEKIA